MWQIDQSLMSNKNEKEQLKDETERLRGRISQLEAELN